MLEQRLKAGEKVDLPYGKLMERLLTIKIIREGILKRRWSGTQPEIQRNVDPKKAAFNKYLIPMAEKKLKEIRY